jgi:hypothetical protein
MGYDPNMQEQVTRLVVDPPVDWAQCFYYAMAGLAALMVAIKTLFVIRKRRKKEEASWL